MNPVSPTPSPTAPFGPGTVRWAVLSTLTELQANWSAAQIAVHKGLSLEVVLRTLNWLRERKLCDLKVWVAIDSLYTITQHGRDVLAAAGAQLKLGV